MKETHFPQQCQMEEGETRHRTTESDWHHKGGGRQERKTGTRLTTTDRQFTFSTITEGKNISQGETTFAYKKKPTMCMSNNFAPNSMTPVLPAHLTSQAGNGNLVLSECSSASRIQYCQDGLRLPKQSLHLRGELAKRLSRCTDQNKHTRDEAVKSSPWQQPFFCCSAVFYIRGLTTAQPAKTKIW